MDNETTRLINDGGNCNTEGASTGKDSQAANNCSTTQDSFASTQQENTDAKSEKKGRTVAAGVGGFVAGAAVGVGATAYATSKTEEIPVDEEVKEDASQDTDIPSPEQAILANDEGIRYAHVDADNFNDAFSQAREQVGPGGLFEYNGKLYGTYTANEWNEMSMEERADYQNRVNEVAPAHHSDSAHVATNVDEVSLHDHSHAVAAPEVIPANAEMIFPEPADNEIRVLGVEAVENPNGDVMNVALIECEGDHVLLVDVDNSGTIDVAIHDDNYDGQIQPSEVYDISEAGMQVSDLLQAQAAQEGQTFTASADDMPDYINDSDSIMSV